MRYIKLFENFKDIDDYLLQVQNSDYSDMTDELFEFISEEGWLEQLEKEADATMKPIRPQYIIKVLNDKIADNAVISLDVGENCSTFILHRHFSHSDEILLRLTFISTVEEG